MASTFLRRVLALDAAFCGASGVALILGAEALDQPLGLSAALLMTAGMLLLPVAAFVTWLASRPVPPKLLVWALILGNCAWVVESFVLLAYEAERVSALGSAVVAGQAAATLGVALLEYVGLRRLRPLTA